jgi:Xaa-Pro aminopeptidase
LASAPTNRPLARYTHAVTSSSTSSTSSTTTERTSASALSARRERLARAYSGPVVIAAGRHVPRNYPANVYPFRASSHFLYFVGRGIADAALWLEGGRSRLYVPPLDADDALWHGPRPGLAELGRELEIEVCSIDDLAEVVAPVRDEVATLPPQDAATARWLSGLLGRAIDEGSGDALVEHRDQALADAMITLRLRHDDAAVARIRETVARAAAAHRIGMRATQPGMTEAEILAPMLAELRRHQLEDAYHPIVTVSGEVLHNDRHHQVARAGDLLLADVGGEHPEGWASDITRTWPVSGRFSPTQRAIYDVVLAAQIDAAGQVRAGVRYRDVHELAKRRIVEGLRALRILKGEVDGLLERGAAALFFPHGIGHLLGLDVHDMEDLGDRAGYAPGRSRSDAFGDRYLRMDRDLAPGMVVTIEPGFYQVPAILADPTLTARVGRDLDRDELARYGDVRGIRIEDDVLCTDLDPEILSHGVPKEAAEIEALMADRARS